MKNKLKVVGIALTTLGIFAGSGIFLSKANASPLCSNVTQGTQKIGNGFQAENKPYANVPKVSKKLPSVNSPYWMKYHKVRVSKKTYAYREKLISKNNVYVNAKKVKKITLKKNQILKVKSFGIFGWKIKSKKLSNSANYYWTVKGNSAKWIKPYKKAKKGQIRIKDTSRIKKKLLKSI